MKGQRSGTTCQRSSVIVQNDMVHRYLFKGRAFRVEGKSSQVSGPVQARGRRSGTHSLRGNHDSNDYRPCWVCDMC